MRWFREFPTPRQTRLALMFGIPLAIVFGQRALAWAEGWVPKLWSDQQVLTAADLNAEFVAIRTELDALGASGKGVVFLGEPITQPAPLATNEWASVEGSPVVLIAPPADGYYRVSAAIPVVASTEAECRLYLGVQRRSSLPEIEAVSQNALVTVPPGTSPRTIMQVSSLVFLQGGNSYIYGLRAFAEGCKSASIETSGGQNHATRLIAERVR